MPATAVLPVEHYELHGEGIEVTYRRGMPEVRLTLADDPHLGSVRPAEAGVDLLGVRVVVELLVSRSNVRHTLTLLPRDYSEALSGRQATYQVYDIRPLVGTMTLRA